MEIDFAYINEVEQFKENYEEIYVSIIEETARQLSITTDLELSCILVDDKKIHEINKMYRNIDRSTDVISFALEDNEQFYVEGQPRSLGDIFISVDHAKLQAIEYEHSLKREMCFLFTHGLLHLLGYDHMEATQEQEMLKKQKEILEALEIRRN